MRNRNVIVRKLEQLDSTLINLRRIVNTQEPIEIYKATIVKAQDLVEDIKSQIEQEPFSPEERNSSIR